MFKKDIYSFIFISLFSVFLNFIFQFISTNQLSDNFYKFTGFDYRYGSIFENLPILKYIIILFTNLGIYYFYRLFLNTTLSLLELYFFISPLNLYNLTQSIGRDYIRIVFIVFLLSALIQLYKKHKYLFVYLIQIVSLGLGLVFRKDFFILMILIIICYQYIIFNSDNLKEDFKKFYINLFLVIFFSICIYLLAPIPLFTDLSRGAQFFEWYEL